MRHGRRAFLPFGERFFRFAYFGPLQVTDLERNLFQRGGNQRERREIGGV